MSSTHRVRLTSRSGMNNRNRLSQSSQITNEDLLHTRVKSTGIHETLLRSDRINYRVFDPSGATVERRKWSKVSTDAQCIVFVVPMNSYNVWSDATDTVCDQSGHLYFEFVSLTSKLDY